MDIERKDAWQPSEDQFLAQTVLEHIRRGNTQLNAFEDVSERLGRSAAACGFRWNSTVRKEYEDAIKEAKEFKRNSLKKTRKPIENQILVSNLSEDNTITIEQVKYAINRIQEHIRSMRQELDKRSNEINFIQQKLDILMKPEHKLSEDYNTLIEILKRARSLGALKSS